jgi:EAL domain-containing protein (putative c-di-GMP-specific phosphodiesterase class I)
LLKSEIHEVQGFLFSRPIPHEEFTEILRTNKTSGA